MADAPNQEQVDQIAELRNMLGSQFEKAWADPKLKPKLRKVIKEFNPDADIPEVDLAESIDTFKTEVKEILSDFDKRYKTDRKSDYLDEGFETLRDNFSYSDEDMAAVKKIMIDERIGNMNIAASYYNSTRKPIAEPNQTPMLKFRPSDFDSEEEYKELGDINTARKLAHAKIDSFMR